MTVCNILSNIPIDENTAIVVEGSRELFGSGTGILDENGKPFVVLSVGMDGPINTDAMLNKASLLIEGNFDSKKLFV